MAKIHKTEIAKSDLLTAWAVLENLAVSFDQIGGTCTGTDDGANGAEHSRTLQQALAAYVTPELVKTINEARMRLGQYVSDEEAEALAERIAYWDYKTVPQLAEKNAP